MMPHNPEQAKLRWRCQRGMLELDIILQRFFDKHYSTLSTAEKEQFVRLLEYDDPQLLAWLLHQEIPSDQSLQSIILIIRNST